MRRLTLAAVVAAAAVTLVADTADAQPGVDKANAIPVGPLSSGDSFSGTNAGVLTANNLYHLLTVAEAPGGIYEHVLTMTSENNRHRSWLRGLSQSTAGVIRAASVQV